MRGWTSKDDNGRDRGQAALLVVVVAAVLFAAASSALVMVGDTVVDRARAQTAADAAALASLDGGREVAAAFAERHGASLISWVRGPGPDDVTVVVRRGDVTASSRASNGP